LRLVAPMKGIANLRSQPPHRGILRISPTNILLTLILLRQLLPNRLPPWMTREALAQLTRHVESIQLEADPSLEILPARGNPWSAVPVDDKKIPTRIIGIFVHQKFLEAFPHLPLALMDVMALIDKFDP